MSHQIIRFTNIVRRSHLESVPFSSGALFGTSSCLSLIASSFELLGAELWSDLGPDMRLGEKGGSQARMTTNLQVFIHCQVGLPCSRDLGWHLIMIPAELEAPLPTSSTTLPSPPNLPEKQCVLHFMKFELGLRSILIGPRDVLQLFIKG